MRSISIFAILLLAATPAVAEQAPPQVCFTPGGICTDLIVSEIASAQHSILVLLAGMGANGKAAGGRGKKGR